eukprot:m.17624 g.17624  ORF g.17624 m.17624 type:complete len:104 (+) comp9385_c1_seq1:322-633(+)
MQAARRLLNRTPMISFPRRRTDDGSPLINLSLEALRSGVGAASTGRAASTPSSQAASTAPQSAVSAMFTGSHHPAALDKPPARFQRSVLSEDEIELFNLGGIY